jgi:hypothetical protein
MARRSESDPLLRELRRGASCMAEARDATRAPHSKMAGVRGE